MPLQSSHIKIKAAKVNFHCLVFPFLNMPLATCPVANQLSPEAGKAEVAASLKAPRLSLQERPLSGVWCSHCSRQPDKKKLLLQQERGRAALAETVAYIICTVCSGHVFLCQPTAGRATFRDSWEFVRVDCGWERWTGVATTTPLSWFHRARTPWDHVEDFMLQECNFSGVLPSVYCNGKTDFIPNQEDLLKPAISICRNTADLPGREHHRDPCHRSPRIPGSKAAPQDATVLSQRAQPQESNCCLADHG